MTTKEDEILAGDPRRADTHGKRIDADASPDTIEKQIDAKRADINRTLSALEERFSPGQMVDQTVSLFRENGGEMAQNLGRQVRDNPLPFILTGVGLAWAMVASSSPPRGGSSMGHYRSRYGYDGDYRGRDFDERYGEHDIYEQSGDHDRARGSVGDDGSDFTPRYTAGTVPSTSGSFAADQQSDEHDEGLLAKARERFGEMGDHLSEKADELSDNVAGMSEDAKREYHARKADLRRRRAQWDRGVREGLDSARGYGRDASYRMRRGARSAGHEISNFVQEQPMVVGALGVAVGAIIGALLPASEVEDRYLGQHADEAKRIARERGESGIERVREEAEGGLEQLRDKVEDVASTARTKVEESVEQARATAEDRLDEADRKASPDGQTTTPRNTSNA